GVATLMSVDADEAEIRNPPFARRGEFNAHPLARRELLHRRIVVGQIEPVDVIADRRVGAVETNERDRDRRLALALEAAHDDRGRLDDAFETGFDPRVALLERALAIGARGQISETG